MRSLTLDEAETKRQKAVEFLRRIGNDDAADEFDSMSAQDYAAHKGAELINNPTKTRTTMAGRRTKSKHELQAELDEANDYIEQLEAKLDDIAGIVTDEDDEEDDDDEGEDDE